MFNSKLLVIASSLCHSSSLKITIFSPIPTKVITITVLVGGFNPSEKCYIATWDDYSKYMEK